MPPFFIHLSKSRSAASALLGVALVGPAWTDCRASRTELREAQAFEPQLDLGRHGRIDRELVFEWPAENEH